MSKFLLGFLPSGILLYSIFSFYSPAYASFSCDVGKRNLNRRYDYGEVLNVIKGWIIRVEDPQKVIGYKTLQRLVSTNGLQKLTEATYQSDKSKRNNGLWDRNQGVFATKNSQGSTLSVVLNPGVSGPTNSIQCYDYTKNLVVFYEFNDSVLDYYSGSRLPAIGIVKVVRRLEYKDKYGSF